MHKDLIAQELLIYNKIRMNAYFDFETTFDEDNIFVKRGYKINDNNIIREQVDFAYSLIFDIKIPLGKLVTFLAFRYEQVADYDEYMLIDDYDCNDEIAEFTLPAASNLMKRIQD